MCAAQAGILFASGTLCVNQTQSGLIEAANIPVRNRTICAELLLRSAAFASAVRRGPLRPGTNLREHPAAGRRFEDYETVREYLLQGTSFSLLYTVARDTIWIIDVRDQRGLRSAEALRQFLRELRAKLG